MIDKLKTHVLWIVTLILGYSGYSRAQDPDASLVEEASATILPEVYPESIRLREDGEVISDLRDPFKIAVRFDMSQYAQPIDDSYENAPLTGDGNAKVPIIALESTLSFGGREFAYFNGKSVDRGDTIVVGAGGGEVRLVKVGTLKVVVEYLGEYYTLHIHDSPRLQIGQSRATVMGRARQGGAAEGDPTKATQLDAYRQKAEQVMSAQAEADAKNQKE